MLERAIQRRARLRSRADLANVDPGSGQVGRQRLMTHGGKADAVGIRVRDKPPAFVVVWMHVGPPVRNKTRLT
ncbi:MAG TPA: hypothetical protein P5032_10165 [Candidatus Competibacter sp.]|nr:hypothetical protein [Candidatus Competibacter sp.]